MEARIQRFRREASRFREGRQRGAGPYPPELRRLAVAVGRDGLAQGLSVNALAAKLGITDVTLQSWLGSAPGFQEVEVVAENRELRTGNGRAVSILTPQGYRIDGLDAESAVAVLRELS